MKNIILTILLFYTVAFVWGQNQEEKKGGAGFGIIFANDFNAKMTRKGTHSNTPFAHDSKVNAFNVGLFAYGDFVYVEMVFGIFYGGGAINIDQSSAQNGYFQFVGTDIGLYGKYPFIISEKITLFPLLGMDYQPTFFALYDDFEMAEAGIAWNQFWFKAGGGIDYKLKNNLHLRFEVLYGIRMANETENKLDDSSILLNNTSIGHGFTVRIALGI